MRFVEIWDSILAWFGIKTSITSDKKQSENTKYTEKYRDTTDINYTAVISNKLSKLAISDSDFSVLEDNKRAELLNGIAKTVWDKIEKLGAMCLGTGGVLLVPYVQNGKILFDIVTQDRLHINNMSGTDILSATVLADITVVNESRYYRFVNYDIQNNNLIITNKVTTEYGRPANVEKWSNIQDIAIANVERVPFGFIKSPVDNRKCKDDYGVPITYGCDKIIEKIKKCLEQIEDEYDLKQTRVRIDERDCEKDQKGNAILKSKLFIKGRNIANENMFDIFDPAIRDSSYYARLIKLYEELEKAIGLSRGILTEPNASYENSQKIREALGDTWAIVSDLRKAIEKGITDFLYACDVLANYFGLTPAGEYVPSFDWDYSLIESSTETWQQLKDGQSIGIRSKAELRAWQTGESIEEAQKKIDEITQKEPPLQALIGMSE